MTILVQSDSLYLFAHAFVRNRFLRTFGVLLLPCRECCSVVNDKRFSLLKNVEEKLEKPLQQIG